MVVYGVADVQLFSPLILAFDGSKWSASCRGHLATRERGPHTHQTLGQVGPRASLDVVEKR